MSIFLKIDILSSNTNPIWKFLYFLRDFNAYFLH